MCNYPYCKAILKISQVNEGLKDPKHGLPVSPSSSFSPFFASAGGVTVSPTEAICSWQVSVMGIGIRYG